MSDEQGKEEATKEAKGGWLTSLKAWAVLLPIVTTALSISGTYYVTQYSNRLRTLNYNTQSISGIIPKVELGGKEFQITVDGKRVDNISTVTVALFNLSDRDIDDIPVVVTFEPDGSDQRPELIQAKPRTSEHTFVELPPPTTKAMGKRLDFAYNIPVANRSTTAFFQVDYTFAGPKAPKPILTINKKGVASEFLELSRPTDGESIAGVITLALSGVSLGIVIATLLSILSNSSWGRKKRGTAKP